MISGASERPCCWLSRHPAFHRLYLQRCLVIACNVVATGEADTRQRGIFAGVGEGLFGGMEDEGDGAPVSRNDASQARLQTCVVNPALTANKIRHFGVSGVGAAVSVSTACI